MKSLGTTVLKKRRSFFGGNVRNQEFGNNPIQLNLDVSSAVLALAKNESLYFQHVLPPLTSRGHFI